MMSTSNFSAWNPSLCTDLAGFACSLIPRALLVSQSSRICACSPTSNPYIICRQVSTPCLTSRLYCRSQLHHPGWTRALLQPAPVDPVSTLSFELELRVVDSYANLWLTMAISFVLVRSYCVQETVRLCAARTCSVFPWRFPHAWCVGGRGALSDPSGGRVAADAGGGHRCRRHEYKATQRHEQGREARVRKAKECRLSEEEERGWIVVKRWSSSASAIEIRQSC